MLDNGHTPETTWPADTRSIVCRGIRGAITVEENSREAILAATRQLLIVIIRLNRIAPEDVASAFFTTTVDLNTEYPAVAARQLGWHEVPLLCAHEMNVPQGLKQVVRVLVNWNTRKSQQEVHHVYLKEARTLRPERSWEMSELVAELEKELTEEEMAELRAAVQ
jgi:chorismate mutase